MVKLFRYSFFALVISFLLSGCGKQFTLENGDITSDESVTSVGRFDCNVVDISHFEDGFECVSAFCSDSGFSYLLSDKYYYLNPNDFYYVSFNSDGKVIVSESLSLPIYSDQNRLVVADNFNLGDISNYSLSVAGGFINYSDFCFGDNGYLSAVCSIGAELTDISNSGKIYRDFGVVWDETGKCILISQLDEYEYEYSESESVYDFDRENDYSFVSSGIYIVDKYKKYVSDYFNFLNSDVKSTGFATVVFKDNDHFSGIFIDEEGNTVLGCFVRNNKIRNCKPILIAITDCSDELLDFAYKYNMNNSSFRIAFSDYSAKAESNDPEAAWSLLKEDIYNGFRPDIIVNTTGYDSLFIDRMKENSLLSDLKEILSKDVDLGEVSFSDKAIELYYNAENIYSVVPSYTYSTVVGNSADFALYAGWGYSDFSSFTSDIIGKKMLFYYDTPVSFIDRVLAYNGFDYVDYIGKSTSFESDEYISFLKYASSLPADMDAANELFYSETNLGMYLLSDIECKNLGDMHYYSTLYSMGDYSDIGFPHGMSGEGSGVLSADMSIMIMSTNAYTNECWGVIKGFLLPDYQENLRTGIPVTASGFKCWCEKLYASGRSIEESVYYKDGVAYSVPNVTEDVVDFFKTRIGNCDKVKFADYRVKKIAIDYAIQYFDGLITAEEAASMTDKDVSAYLATL